MRKLICVVFIILLFCSTLSISAFADSNIKLYVNNNEIFCDTPPIIISGRTLVPVRAVFSGFDAEVNWDDSIKRVTVQKDDVNISLDIGSKIAVVNSNEKTLDVEPIIINDRCMIPIRFVSETLGYDVKWNDNERSVYINEPESELLSVNKIKIIENSNNNIVSIVFDESIAKSSVMTLGDPYRIVIDYTDAFLSIGDGSKQVSSGYVNEVRWARHNNDCRVVIECPAKQPYFINEDGNVYSITVGDASSNTNGDNSGLLVVLDAGHGGSDPGALGKDENGNIELYEKDANLSIALAVRDILVDNGVRVKMTRQTDKFVPLMDIAGFANDNDADFFVSIHNNALEDASVSGTLVMYNDTEEKNAYGIKSSYAAEVIRDSVIESTGLVKRYNPNSPRILVLNQTKMPAVLVECAFVTNKSDRDYLNSDEGINSIAEGIANGILKVLKVYKNNISKN